MLIFLYGEDNFRSRLKLNELKDKYRREVDKLGSGLKVLAGAKAAFSEIAAAVSPSSLLSKKRLIVVEDVFLNKDQAILEKLLDYFKKRETSDNIIIFWESGLKLKKIKNVMAPMFIGGDGQDKPLNKKPAEFFKFLTKQKYTSGFNRLSNTESADWAKKQAAARGGKISAKAAELLVGLVGVDGWQISNELDKLISYKAANPLRLVESEASKLTGAEADIEVEDVRNLVQGNFSENIFALTDALSVRNKALAAKLLSEQLEAGLDEGRLLNMFVWQFRALLQIKQATEAGLSQRQIASQLKLHPYVAQKGLEQARNFTLPILKNMLSRLAEIDYQVKSGRGDFLAGLNMLIATI